VIHEGFINDIGVNAYCGPNMAANILSYDKLQETHYIQYDGDQDTFCATPALVGPTLIFSCVNGHYILDLVTLRQVFRTNVSHNAAKYSKRQLLAARMAYDFISRMGFISNKAAAEVVQRGSINNLGFTRADLVNAQDIFGSPTPYQLGHGTNKLSRQGTMTLFQSTSQVDLFFFLGQVFFLSISVLLGLIMVTHRGPGIDRSTSDRHGERSKSKAAQSLSLHIRQYEAKGFRIKRVTSDGEPSIRAAKQELESNDIELNILGGGSCSMHRPLTAYRTLDRNTEPT
jgi:hypothetical protein